MLNSMLNWMRNRRLLKAAARGNLKTVKALVAKGADVNAEVRVCIDGVASPLYCAIAGGHLPIVEFFVAHGAYLNAKKGECDKAAALCEAANNGHLALVEFFVANGADVNAKTRGYRGETTALHEAISHLDVVRYLVTHGAEVNTKDKRGYSPLQEAIRGDNFAVAAFLVAHGADVNSECRDSSPLATAARCGNLPIVELLLQRGARDINNAMVSAIAQYGSCEAVIAFLVTHGADVNFSIEGAENDGGLLLHLAARWGNVAAVKILVAHGADTSAKDQNDDTPLQCALTLCSLAFSESPRKGPDKFSAERAREMIPFLLPGSGFETMLELDKFNAFLESAIKRTFG